MNFEEVLKLAAKNVKKTETQATSKGLLKTRLSPPRKLEKKKIDPDVLKRLINPEEKKVGVGDAKSDSKHSSNLDSNSSKPKDKLSKGTGKFQEHGSKKPAGIVKKDKERSDKVNKDKDRSDKVNKDKDRRDKVNKDKDRSDKRTGNHSNSTSGKILVKPTSDGNSSKKGSEPVKAKKPVPPRTPMSFQEIMAIAAQKASGKVDPLAVPPKPKSDRKSFGLSTPAKESNSSKYPSVGKSPNDKSSIHGKSSQHKGKGSFPSVISSQTKTPSNNTRHGKVPNQGSSSTGSSSNTKHGKIPNQGSNNTGSSANTKHGKMPNQVSTNQVSNNTGSSQQLKLNRLNSGKVLTNHLSKGQPPKNPGKTPVAGKVLQKPPTQPVKAAPQPVKATPQPTMSTWDRIYQHKAKPKKRQAPSYSDEEDEDDEDMADFIDDGDDDDDYKKMVSDTIKSRFGYDKTKFKDDDFDDRRMEAGYADIMKEEARSARLARLEDAEDIKKEEEYNRRKKLKKIAKEAKKKKLR